MKLKTSKTTLDVYGNVFLHCFYKNMHGTNKHKMKDGVYLFQERGRKSVGKVPGGFVSICDALFLKIQRRFEANMASMHLKFTETIIVLTQMLTSYSDLQFSV
jgi:hypothetical protein